MKEWLISAFMYNSVECKNLSGIVCFLYVEQIIEGYTFIMIGLQETFIEGVLIETLDNQKQGEEGKER